MLTLIHTSAFLVHLLGLLSFLAYIPSTAIADGGEATFINSSCPVEIIHTVSPYWTSNGTDEGELEKALQDIVEVIALQEQTLNSLLLNVSNWNQSEEQTAMNRKEVFPELLYDFVKLSHEEEGVLTHPNQSHYAEVGNNDTEEYEKYLRIIRDKTQHMDHMVNILEINLQLFEPDNGLIKERKQNNNTYECAVSSTQKFLVQQHITTSKHQANKQLNSKQRQLFLTQPTTSNVRSEFNIDLCRSLISADIPLYKLKHKVFREFLEKYTQHTIPDESTLRKTYAPSIYDETIQKIRDEIKDSSIWVSIDETPDKEGRLVGNVVIGLLSEQYSERILLHCDVLEKCNNKTIVKLFNEAMGILWPKDMSVFLLHLLGMLSYLAYVPSAAVADGGEATTKTFINSSCPVEIIHTVSPNDTDQGPNDTDEGELKKALQDIVEVIALQEETLNSLLLNVSNFNQSEERTAINRKETFPEPMSDLVKLSHEEEGVLTHPNQSHSAEVGNNDTEEYEKYLRIIQDKTQHMDHMVNILEINLQLFEPDDGLAKETKQNNNTSESFLKQRVLTEEMLDEIGYRLEISPETSSRRIAQQVGVSQSSVIRVTNNNLYGGGGGGGSSSGGGGGGGGGGRKGVERKKENY
ncbi:hypothetical protein ANN_00195 [Periplaneta americana]|uniref:DUF659 domain-containing protein n=1 Tax=Periplaneta americana TaxID=6978 RepID=A0ABQ8TTB5_PERAM|nr:hypothetical protein ANN_00195 [Periplaneta americana]